MKITAFTTLAAATWAETSVAPIGHIHIGEQSLPARLRAAATVLSGASRNSDDWSAAALVLKAFSFPGDVGGRTFDLYALLEVTLQFGKGDENFRLGLEADSIRGKR